MTDVVTVLRKELAELFGDRHSVYGAMIQTAILVALCGVVVPLDRPTVWRDAGAVARALERVESDARAGRNLMPAIVYAVKAYASVGEISERMVGVWGRYAEPVRFDDPDLAALAKEAA